MTLAATAPPNKLRVTPIKTELSVRPGETVEEEIILQNQGPGAFRVGVSVQDYVTTADGSYVFAKGTGNASEDSFSCARWIQTGETTLTLVPGSIVRYPVKVVVPRNAEPGGKNAAVIFTMLGPQSGDAGVGISGRIASQYLVTVSGKELREEARVGDLSITKPLMSRSVASQIPFTNGGNVHLNVAQEIRYTNVFGQVVGAYAQPAVTVLPVSDRVLSGEWTAPYLGWFQARAVVRYGSDQSHPNRVYSPDPVSFWVLSPEALTIGIIALAVVVAVVSVLWRMWVRRPERNAVSDGDELPIPRPPLPPR